MKNDLSQENIDDLIRESLSAEEAEYYNQLDEQGVFAQMTDLFKGKMKWWTVMIFMISFLLAIVAFYCLYQFLQVETEIELIKWGAGMFAGMFMLSMLKLWSWNQMDKNAIIREMKRLEYQISLINHGHEHKD